MNIVRKSALLFGKCVTSDLPPAIRVCVTQYELDQKLLAYFDEKHFYYAEDPKNECNVGDYILIREAENQNKKITHIVDKLIYKQGYFYDPLTGRKCAGREYIDDIVRLSALFGKKLPYVDPPSDTVNKNSTISES